MNASFLLYLAAFLTAAWGIAHLFPTKNVVKGFGAISLDNRRVITMEWINEGATLIFIGILTAAVTLVDPTSLAQTIDGIEAYLVRKDVGRIRELIKSLDVS